MQAVAPEGQKPRRSAVAAACMGYGIEFYDFTIYNFFAVYIGLTFFPAHDPSISLLLSLATFGIGFFMRPVGSILIGRIGDRVGRRAALILTMVLMSLGTILIACTPSYASIGLAAPILVVLGRLLQGFALGGEMGPATTMLIEMAPPGRRSFYSAWLMVAQGLAALIAGLFALGLTLLLPADAMTSWGWRVPFIVGLLIIPAGIYMRRTMPETLTHADRATAPATPMRELFAGHARLMLAACAVLGSLSVTVYIAYYMSSYALATLGMSGANAAAASLVNGLVIIACALAGGYIADRIGRRPVVLWTRIAMALLALPLFLLLHRHTSSATLMAVTAIIMGLSIAGTAAAFTMIPEALPKTIRSTGLSILIAISTSLFGGTTQFTVAALQRATGDPLAPAYMLLAASLLGVFGALWLKETRDQPLSGPCATN